MRKMKHTVQIALSINARIIDNQGRPISAYILPVVYLFLWLPSRLYSWLATPSPDRCAVSLYLLSWQTDLKIIWHATSLLAKGVIL